MGSQLPGNGTTRLDRDVYFHGTALVGLYLCDQEKSIELGLDIPVMVGSLGQQYLNL